jgi:hypothetical protein
LGWALRYPRSRSHWVGIFFIIARLAMNCNALTTSVRSPFKSQVHDRE